MPANLSAASVSPSNTVLPNSLSTSFVETQSFPLLSTLYHDGTIERSLIQDGVNPPRPARTWTLAKRLTTAQLSDLLTFWEVTVLGGLKPFKFYDPYGVSPGNAVGSNYDATGASSQGRVIVHFVGDWARRTGLGRNDVQVVLVEVT